MAAESSGRAILLPVAVALVGLVAIGVGEDIPVRHSAEHNLADRSSTALQQAGVPFSAVRFVGRDGTVTVPSADAGSRAIAVVQHVNGVRVVHVIVGTAPGGTAVIAEPSPDVSLTAVPASPGAAPSTSSAPAASPEASASPEPSISPTPSTSTAPSAAPSSSAAPSASATPSPSQSTATSVQKQLDALGEITFGSGSATLSSHDRSIVKKAAAILKAHPDIDLTVTGNTDSSGPAAANLVLSRQRAHAVADALHADGIATSRLKVVGNGESKPKVPNNSPRHRATNRRVDLFAKGSPLG